MGRRKTVDFFQAEDLFSEADDIAAKRIEHGGSEIVTIIDRVHPRQVISRGNNVVQTGGSEIFSDN